MVRLGSCRGNRDPNGAKGAEEGSWPPIEYMSWPIGGSHIVLLLY